MLRKINWVLLFLLSLSTGLVKIFGLEADIQIFSYLGFSAEQTMLFGILQTLGAILLIFPKTIRWGAIIMAVTFVVATIAVFMSGNLQFAIFSILFILMALVPLRTERNSPLEWKKV